MPISGICKQRPRFFGLQRPCPKAARAGNDSASPETSPGGADAPSLPGHCNLQACAPALAPLPHQGPPLGGPDWEVPRQAGDSTGNGSGGLLRGRQQIINLLINSRGPAGGEGAVPPQF